MTARPGPIPLPAAAVDWLALAAALTSVILWASAFVGIRALADDVSPGPLAFGRLLVGSVMLGVLAAWRRDALPRGRDVWFVIAAGVLWFGGYNLTLNAAEQLVDAGTAAMLVTVGPLFIVALGGLFLGEGFPPRLVVGAIVAFGGAVVIGIATTDGAAGPDAALGIFLCVLAALSFAVGVTFEKPALARVSALNVTFLACSVGTVVTMPFAPQLIAELGEAPRAVAWTVYLGVAPTAIAFTTWAFALNRTTAGRLGSTAYLVAPLTIVLGWFMLGEVPPLLAIGGGVVTIAGVIIARSSVDLRTIAGRRVAGPRAPVEETAEA